MSANTIELSFGNKSFPIRRFTINQLCELDKLFSKSRKGEGGSASEMAAEAIRIALSRDHKDTDVMDLECDVAQLPSQLVEIMKLAGFPTESKPEPAVATE